MLTRAKIIKNSFDIDTYVQESWHYLNLCRMGKEQNDETKDLMITIVGSSGVGKTTIAKSLIGSNSEDIEKPSIFDVYEKRTKLHGSNVNIRINDIKSDAVFAAQQMIMAEKSDVLIIAFSRDSHGTFQRAINIYNTFKNLNVFIVFIGTVFQKNAKKTRNRKSKWELEKEFKDYYNSLYFEFSEGSRGKSILEKLYEEVEIRRGPYYTTVISMNQIRI